MFYNAISLRHAWVIVGRILYDRMLGDCEFDDDRSFRAGHPIYSSTSARTGYWWVSDLGDRLEVNLPAEMGAESINVRYCSAPKFNADAR